MALQLNKLVLVLGLLLSGVLCAQKNSDNITRPPDDDPVSPNGDFSKFEKRRKNVAKWQIKELKDGAIIVRLQTNKLAIEKLRKAGNEEGAVKKENETIALNKLYYRAFTNHFRFCKLYFIYTTSTDSLLKGVRKGIFLDSNLVTNDSIKLDVAYYLLADKDVVYNSSIGFVSEEQAPKVREAGTPTKQAFIVLKNKYGHQLKNPFPYFVLYNSFFKSEGLDKDYIVAIQKNGQVVNVPLDKQYRQERLNKMAMNLSRELGRFYEENKTFILKDKDLEKYLY
ncbi:MAG: hypothetical protein QM534_11040 [Sediminibacterium sp.]|nr:hypothetical protein [Sediminibacterium sp.]